MLVSHQLDKNLSMSTIEDSMVYRAILIYRPDWGTASILEVQQVPVS
jgi:hypothetical protein